MGTQGVPWEKDQLIISAAIKKHRGRITHIAKDPTINCAINTVRTRINTTPELKAEMEDIRQHWVEDNLDKAEDVLGKLMDNVAEDGACALRSAMFFLNNQGKDRGYAAPESKTLEVNENLATFLKSLTEKDIKQE